MVFIGLSQMAVESEQKMICDGAPVTGPVPGAIADIESAFIGSGDHFVALLR